MRQYTEIIYFPLKGLKGEPGQRGRPGRVGTEVGEASCI